MHVEKLAAAALDVVLLVGELHLHAAAPRRRRTPSLGCTPSDEEEEEEEDSDTDTYAQGFQLRKVGGGDEEGEEVEGDSSESEPEPEPVKKESAKKAKAEAKKKRAAPEPAPSGKAKKAKPEKSSSAAAPEPAPSSGKSKKAAKAEAAKAAAAEPAPSTGKVSKYNLAPEPSPSSKSGKALSRWTTDDEVKILEVLVAHFKSHGTQLKVEGIIAAVGDSLERKSIKYSDMYEKVRRLKQRYEATAKKVEHGGDLPAKEDDLRMYQLSSEIWGKNAKDAGNSSKNKKGQAKKDKVSGDSKEAAKEDKVDEAAIAVNEKGGTLAENKKGKTNKQKTGMETKVGSSKEAALAASPTKGKKKGSHKDKLDEEAKSGTAKVTSTIATDDDDGTLGGSKREKAGKEELDGDTHIVMPKEATTTAASDDGTLVGSKKGKADNGKLDGDTHSVMPKEATAGTQNGGILTGGENHKEKVDKDANVPSIRREYAELQSLYPNLASFVNGIEAQHPCGSTFKRAFEFISDDKACTLESKIKKQKIAEVRMQLRLADTKKEVANALLGLLD